MGTDIIFADRFGACGLYLLPLGDPDGQLALCKALAGAAQRTRVGGVVGPGKTRCEGAARCADAHDPALEYAADDRHRRTRPLRFARGTRDRPSPPRARAQQQISVAVGIHLGDGIGEMALVRPNSSTSPATMGRSHATAAFPFFTDATRPMNTPRLFGRP